MDGTSRFRGTGWCRGICEGGETNADNMEPWLQTVQHNGKPWTRIGLQIILRKPSQKHKDAPVGQWKSTRNKSGTQAVHARAPCPSTIVEYGGDQKAGPGDRGAINTADQCMYVLSTKNTDKQKRTSRPDRGRIYDEQPVNLWTYEPMKPMNFAYKKEGFLIIFQ